MPLKTYNPDTMPPPAALYSQAVEVPPNARWLYPAGQVGMTPAGEISEGFEAQSRQIWCNSIEALKAGGMGVEDIVRINVYATNPEDIQHLSAIRREFLGEHIPASTWVVVKSLAQPPWVVEQEIIAAKAD